MDRLERPSILETNVLYLFIGILFVFIGSVVQSRELYSGLLITEYLILLLPNLMYLKLMGFSLKKVLRLNKISFKQVGYIVLITIFAYPIAIFFNFIMTMILTYISEPLVDSIPMAETTGMYFLSLFVIALAPGICEEVMFRGTIMSAYGSKGKKKAIIYSAILFGAFHLNLQNLLGPIALGIVLGITVYKTNSIYAGMIGHTISNGIAVTIGFLATKGIDGMSSSDIPALEIPNSIQMLIMLIILGIFALISTIIVRALIKRLPEGKESVPREIISYKHKNIDYFPLVVFLMIFLYVNIKVFFS